MGGKVITGWDQGCLGMSIGEERKLIIPANEGYMRRDFLHGESRLEESLSSPWSASTSSKHEQSHHKLATPVALADAAAGHCCRRGCGHACDCCHSCLSCYGCRRCLW